MGVDNDNNAAFVEVLNDGDGSWIATDEMTISTGGNAEANAVVTDAAGNAYVVGDFSGSLTPTTTSATLVSNGAQNAFMVSFDSSLNELFGVRFGSENTDTGDDVGIDGSGNLYMSGEDGGPSSFGTSSTAVLRGSDTTSNDQAYVIEVSSTGTFKGGAQAGATASTGSATSEAASLAVNSAGKIAVAGTITGAETFGSTKLTNAAGGNFIGSVTPTATVQFSTGSETVNEATGSFSIAVTLAGTSTQAVTVPFTLGGTAVAGTDYSGVTAAPLTFAAGQTTANITGNLVADPGSSRTLTLTLGTPTGAPPWAVPRSTR